MKSKSTLQLQKLHDYCRKIQLMLGIFLSDEKKTTAKVKCIQCTFVGCSLHSNNFENLNVWAFLNKLMHMTIVLHSCWTCVVAHGSENKISVLWQRKWCYAITWWNEQLYIVYILLGQLHLTSYGSNHITFAAVKRFVKSMKIHLCQVCCYHLRKHELL